MRILGISNPGFTGVTIATKAICTDWMPAQHMTKPFEWQALCTQINHYGPELLILGGWSDGYMQLLTELRRAGHKDFPIMAVSHSTPFHGSYFHPDWKNPEYEVAFKNRLVDLMGFVHPQTARFYQAVKKTFAAFVPHAFQPVANTSPKDGVFRIGLLGGAKHWYKNIEGSLLVANEFANARPNVEVIVAEDYSRPREAFLATVGYCSVLIHNSYLECYSNTIQEAWARGIPVITSPASDGLTIENPLLDDELKGAAGWLRLSNPTDPFQLYEALMLCKEHHDFHSRQAYQISTALFDKTKVYNNALFKSIIAGYPHREHDVGLFEAPFTTGIEWENLARA